LALFLFSGGSAAETAQTDPISVVKTMDRSEEREARSENAKLLNKDNLDLVEV
jgi:hypothetical protein